MKVNVLHLRLTGAYLRRPTGCRYLSRDDGNPSAKPVCLGVATQKDTGIATDNIGFLVPAGTVRRFLQVVVHAIMPSPSVTSSIGLYT